MPEELFIVDTDILIDYSRGVEKAKASIVKHEIDHRLAISVITQLELMAGCKNKQDFKLLNAFLKDFEVIPLNASISDKAVELFERFRLSHGVMIPDMLIASTAMVFDIPLLSKNHKDFRFIKDLKLKKYSP
ncbi:type II toxin-antitoxin system VapC family toxin [Balneolaceae bacterium ANBcel3]|nr:type II toxin-antitoxin system VapC family toxin [Balneolaceae bacterium ANBcel3]